MKHFFKYLKLQNLFGKVPDRDLFGETIKIYAKMNWGILRQFLEEYARACTERDVKKSLDENKNPTYTTYEEVKKLIEFLDTVEKNFWQSKEKNIR